MKSCLLYIFFIKCLSRNAFGIFHKDLIMHAMKNCLGTKMMYAFHFLKYHWSTKNGQWELYTFYRGPCRDNNI